MRALSLLSSVAFSASVEAGSASIPSIVANAVTAANPAPVAASPAKPARKPRAAKPSTDTAPVAKPASKRASKPDAAPAPEAKPAVRVTHTAATIKRGACNFGGVLSDRDTAYLTFYAGLAKRARDGRVTLTDIASCGRGPDYNGSAKPHDAGVIQRLTKHGTVKPDADGSSFVFTDTGRKLKAYASAPRA